MLIVSMLIVLLPFAEGQIVNGDGGCNCTFDDNIWYNGNNVYEATSAQAYFWEICSGSATINGLNTGKSVSIKCNEDGMSILRVTRFINGECISSCKPIICKNGMCDPPPCCNKLDTACINIYVEETPQACETVGGSIDENCLPECVDSVVWRIRVGSIDTTITSTIAPDYVFSWGFPQTNFNNHYLVVSATIYCCNGNTCQGTAPRYLLRCGYGGPQKLAGGSTSISLANYMIYPNPVKQGGIINVKNWLNVGNNATIEIIDINGNVLQTSSAKEGVIKLRPSISSGHYLMRIIKSNSVVIIKIYVD